MKVWVCSNELNYGADSIYISREEPFWQTNTKDGSEYWDWEDRYDNLFLCEMTYEDFVREFGSDLVPGYRMKFLADLNLKVSENPISL